MGETGDNAQFGRSDTVHTVSNGGEETGGAFLRADVYVVTEPHKGNRPRLARELGVEGKPILRFNAPTCDHCRVPDVIANSAELLVSRRSNLRLYRNGRELVVPLADDVEADHDSVAASPTAPPPAVAMPTHSHEGAALAHHIREQQVLLEQTRAAVADQRRLFELGVLSLKRQQDELAARESQLAALQDQVDTARGRLKQTLADHDAIIKSDLEVTLALRSKTREAARDDLVSFHDSVKEGNLRRQEQMKLTADFQQGTVALQTALLKLLEAKPSPLEDKLKAVREMTEAILQSNIGEGVAEILASHMAKMYQDLGGKVSVGQVMDGFFVRGAAFRQRVMVVRSLLAIHQASDVAQGVGTTLDFLEGTVSQEAVDLVLRHTIRATVTQQR